MSKEPKRNVYVGHRYVPKLMDEWDKTISYEGLSIVTYQGTSYTSKKRVPVGIDILNEEYWVVTGNYNAQVEQYRQEVRSFDGRITENEDEIFNVSEFVNNEFDDRGYNIKWNALIAAEDGGDWTRAIQTAYDNLKPDDTLYIPGGEYLVNGLNFNKDRIHVKCYGILRQPNDETGVCVTISGRDIIVSGCLNVIRNSVKWDNQSIGVLLLSTNRSIITMTTKRFDKGLVLDDKSRIGTAYNTIYFMDMQDNKKSVYSNPVLSDGWVNENKFYGGRFSWSSTVSNVNEGETLIESFNRNGCIHLDLRNGNNNVFFSPSLEGRGGKLIQIGGSYNTVYSPRFEGYSIFLDYLQGSIYNQVLYPYHHQEINEENFIKNGSRNKLYARNFHDWEETSTAGGSFKAYGDPRRSTHYIDGDGMFQASPNWSNSAKNFRGDDVNGNETFHVKANGEMEVKNLTLTDNSRYRWRDISLADGWEKPEINRQPKYSKNAMNDVKLAGEINGRTGEHQDILFTLPNDYRPSQNMSFSVPTRIGAVGSLEMKLIEITIYGDVRLNFSEIESETRRIILDGINYKTGD